MPNTREKLIELLAPTSLNFEKAVYLADHLIANGVTFATDNNVGDKSSPAAYDLSATESLTKCQQWISVKDRLPEKFHNVLTSSKLGDWYSIELDCIDSSGKWNGDLFRTNEVTHWMPLPEPPKGE